MVPQQQLFGRAWQCCSLNLDLLFPYARVNNALPPESGMVRSQVIVTYLTNNKDNYAKERQ